MTAILALVAVAVPFVITPGASFALTVAHAQPAQAPAWRRITVGTGLGLLALALVVGATGLSALLAAHPALRLGLGLVGAAVLAGYGISIRVKARRPESEQTSAGGPERLVRWSFLIVITNPKALTLYVLIVPTLVIPGLEGVWLSMSFVAVHICLQAVWLCLTHHVVVRIPALAHSTRARRHLLTAAGSLMMVLGAWTAIHSLMQF